MKKLLITNKYRLPTFNRNQFTRRYQVPDPSGSGQTGPYMTENNPYYSYPEGGQSYENMYGGGTGSFSIPKFPVDHSTYGTMPTLDEQGRVLTDPIGRDAVLTDQQMTPTLNPNSNVTLQGTKGFTEGFEGGRGRFDKMGEIDMYYATHDLQRGDEAINAMLGMLSGAKQGGPAGAILNWGTAMYQSMQKDEMQRDNLKKLRESQDELEDLDKAEVARNISTEMEKFIV